MLNNYCSLNALDIRSTIRQITEATLYKIKVTSRLKMKEKIHPQYVDVTIECACGATYQTRSTKKLSKVDICASCHPFYTKKQKVIDSAGRVDKFKRKYNIK